MGVEEKDLHTLVLKQLGVWFGMPITAAIVVAIIVIGYFLQMFLLKSQLILATEP